MRTLLVVLSLLLLPWTFSSLHAQSTPNTPSQSPAQQSNSVILGRGQALDVAWSADGYGFAVASSIGVWLYDVPSLLADPSSDPLYLPTTAAVLDVVFSPTESLIAAALADGTVQLWPLHSGEPARTLTAYQEQAWGVAFTVDGSQLVTIGTDGLGGQDSAARIWDVASLTLTRDLIDPSTFYTINALDLSPNGQWLALADDGGTIHLWQLATGAKAGSWEAHFWYIQDIAFSPNSEWLISGSTDGDVRGWNVATYARIPTLSYQAGGPVFAVAVAPDGSRTASLTDETQLHVAFASGGLQSVVTLAGKSGLVGGMAYSPDGSMLAVIGGDGATHLQIWNTQGPNPVPIVAVTGFQRSMVGVIPYGDELLGVSVDGFVQRWDSDGNQGTAWDIQTSQGGLMTTVVLHPNGTQMVVGDDSGGVRRWSIATQQLEVQYNEGAATLALAYNDDGSRLMLGGESRVVQI